MKLAKCRICGHEHAGVAHVFGAITNAKPAIDKPIAITKPAITSTTRTANRQDRATYNAYQREYKRRMRAA